MNDSTQKVIHGLGACVNQAFLTRGDRQDLRTGTGLCRDCNARAGETRGVSGRDIQSALGVWIRVESLGKV